MDSSSLQIFAENCKEAVSCRENEIVFDCMGHLGDLFCFFFPDWNWMFHGHWDSMWDTGEHLQLWVKAP
jgi:hypothetical protein